MKLQITAVSEYLKSDKGRKLIIIIGIAGLLLILLSEFLPKGKVEQKNEENSTKEYIVEVEKKLGNLIGNIQGVGKNEIMVTLENTVEYVYATEDRVNTDRAEDVEADATTRIQERDNTEKKHIIIDDDNGGQKALVKTQIQPQIKGVVIVCEGGDDVLVQQRVIEAVTIALNLPSNKVCVSKKS